MLSRVFPFVAAFFFAPPAPAPTPPGPGVILPPRADQIAWQTSSDPEVLEVTARVKQDLESRPDYAKLHVRLRKGATDAELVTLVNMLPWVETLTLGDAPRITSLAPVTKLVKLRALHVKANGLKTLASLGKHPSLESLGFTCSKDFVDRDVSALGAVTTLDGLGLMSCPTIKNLHGVENAVNLRSVSTYDTPLANIDALAGHAKIMNLNLHDTQITSLAPLAGMPELGSVNLRGAPAPANEFEVFRKLTKLQFVDLSKTNIASLDVLGASLRIMLLSVPSAMTDAEIVAFQQAHPSTRVTRHGKPFP